MSIALVSVYMRTMQSSLGVVQTTPTKEILILFAMERMTYTYTIYITYPDPRHNIITYYLVNNSIY